VRLFKLVVAWNGKSSKDKQPFLLVIEDIQNDRAFLMVLFVAVTLAIIIGQLWFRRAAAINDNPYLVLEISQNADLREIKKAYRRHSMVYHSD